MEGAVIGWKPGEENEWEERVDINWDGRVREE